MLNYYLFNSGVCPNHKMDVAILADRSRTMKRFHLKKFVQLANRLIDELGVSPEGNHYSFITFGRNGKFHIKFTDQVYHNEAKLKRKMKRKIKYVPEKNGVRVDLALDLAATQLLTSEGGARLDAKKVMIVFTRGRVSNAGRSTLQVIPISQSIKALEVSES